MPRYNRNFFYEAVIIAYLDEKLRNGKKPATRAMSDDLGFSNKTIIDAISRLVAINRLSAQRNKLGKLFDYEIKQPPTQLEKQALEFQLKIKKAASDSLAA
jgi:hypothetical protein